MFFKINFRNAAGMHGSLYRYWEWRMSPRTAQVSAELVLCAVLWLDCCKTFVVTNMTVLAEAP